MGFGWQVLCSVCGVGGVEGSGGDLEEEEILEDKADLVLFMT